MRHLSSRGSGVKKSNMMMPLWVSPLPKLTPLTLCVFQHWQRWYHDHWLAWVAGPLHPQPFGEHGGNCTLLETLNGKLTTQAWDFSLAYPSCLTHSKNGITVSCPYLWAQHPCIWTSVDVEPQLRWLPRCDQKWLLVTFRMYSETGKWTLILGVYLKPSLASEGLQEATGRQRHK